MKMDRTRSESKSGLLPTTKRRTVPSLATLRREGLASSRRIGRYEEVIQRTAKLKLLEWLAQAERLWIAIDYYRLRGKEFLAFAADIGIRHRSSAYQLLKLHPYRAKVLHWCRLERHYPGWEAALAWAIENDDAFHVTGTEAGQLSATHPNGDISSERGTHCYLTGDCLALLSKLEAGSVQTVVTSPLFFAQRDYGTARWAGGDPGCKHTSPPNGSARSLESRSLSSRVCRRCGARWIDEQIGREETPAEYVSNIVAVFRKVKRVLREDGTVWLHLGDTYSSGGRGAKDAKRSSNCGEAPLHVHGMKKQLLGMPWRCAFALQDDGWYLRSAVVVLKSSPMPESCNDRPTSSYDHVFLLSREPDYFYDRMAIAEPAIYAAQHANKASSWGHKKAHTLTMLASPFCQVKFVAFPP